MGTGTDAAVQVCPGCGEEKPPRFRLCGFCGTALPLPSATMRVVILQHVVRAGGEDDDLLEAVDELSAAEQAAFLRGLVTMIRTLQVRSRIPVARKVPATFPS